MALVTRDKKVIWDDKENELPGEIFNKYLKDKNYTKDDFNNYSISTELNKREMIGLKTELEKLV